MPLGTRPWLGLVTAVVVVAGAGAAVASVPADAPEADATGRVLVQYAPGLPGADQDALERQLGARARGTVHGLGVKVLEVPVGAEARVASALGRSGKVRYAEPDVAGRTTATPDDPYWPQQWGLAKVSGPSAWDTTRGDASTVVAVLDTGVDLTHPDLAARLAPGYDVVNADTDPSDDNGHGTSAAGVAAASGGNATGIAGACWSCTILPVKVASSSGSTLWSNLASGITWATDHGADVISISIAGSSGSTTLANALTYAHDRGVVIVAAAGNNGSSTLAYPAAYPQVVSVAGTNESDALYSWSNYGSWVKVAAPGCDTATTTGGGYGTFCGTSAATPLVAGVAGLLRSAVPSASAAQVEDALQRSAVAIGSSVAYGRVDAAAALAAVGASAPAPTTAPTTAPSPSASPSPTASPSPAPTISPTPAPTTAPAPSQATATYSEALNAKSPSRRYTVTTGTGTLTASLSWSKAATLTLSVLDASGQVVAQTSGSGGLTLAAPVTPGPWTVVVDGSGNRTSYTLTVGYPQP